MGHAIWHIFACNLKQSQFSQENNEKRVLKAEQKMRYRPGCNDRKQGTQETSQWGIFKCKKFNLVCVNSTYLDSRKSR